MRKHVMILFCFCMMLFMFGSAEMVLSIQAESSDGKLPESLYLQPPVGICSSCGEPIFEREGSWAEDTLSLIHI